MKTGKHSTFRATSKIRENDVLIQISIGIPSISSIFLVNFSSFWNRPSNIVKSSSISVFYGIHETFHFPPKTLSLSFFLSLHMNPLLSFPGSKEQPLGTAEIENFRSLSPWISSPRVLSFFALVIVTLLYQLPAGDYFFQPAADFYAVPVVMTPG